jgi:hypothetical protein
MCARMRLQCKESLSTVQRDLLKFISPTVVSTLSVESSTGVFLFFLPPRQGIARAWVCESGPSERGGSMSLPTPLIRPGLLSAASADGGSRWEHSRTTCRQRARTEMPRCPDSLRTHYATKSNAPASPSWRA